MNGLIVYFSKFGHTQILAEMISGVLEQRMPIKLISADELKATDLENSDLVIMGTPTHNMNLPKPVKPILARLPKKILHGVPFACFDTSYKMSWWLMPFTAAKRLNRQLKKLGGQPLAAPETFFIMEREGPLYEGEVERAVAWAEMIQELVGRRAAVTA